MKQTAKVYLIGAGPGDPKLLTIKGAEALSKADVVVYDRLVHPAILRHARPDAEMIYVGKASSRHTMKQEDINQLLVDKAKEGKIVARLKGGDPFVYGRGGEEAEELVSEGIAFEVVPGITSAIAVPAYAGIPVTHRKLCSALGIITGHEDPTKTESSIKWDKIATGNDTLVFLMGVENLPNIIRELVKNGRSPETPLALIRWGTRSEQETLVGTLQTILKQVEETGFKSPAVTVVGEVVRLRDTLRWFDNRPLFGKKVIVTRSREQASVLTEKLEELGAEAVEFPVIKIVPIADFGFGPELDSGSDLPVYDWIIFTSANGVEIFIKRLFELGHDVRAMGGAKLAAIGPATAAALHRYGLKVDYVPSEFVAEAVVQGFPEDPSGKKILLARAKEAREALPEMLMEMGADVTVLPVYETIVEDSDAGRVREMIQAGEVDIVTFTSSSTVKNFVGLLDGIQLPENVTVACIGPITAKTAQELGLEPDIVAEDYTIDGLVEAVLK
ncbi:MAG: uroporphyrinogen-III C-methyltransferase, partial [Armatimonadetes bacterium]|nr:uroporphyrinogen-III C-methyltransferase [Armatimonadota bacterium]